MLAIIETAITIGFSFLTVILTSLGTIMVNKKDGGSQWTGALMLIWASLTLASLIVRVST